MEEEKKSGRLIIISGPVGAGKSTLACQLAQLATIPTTYIECDHFWGHLAKLAPIDDTHFNYRAIMRAMSAASIAYAAVGYESILDFTIGPWYLEAVNKFIGTRNIRVDYLVLMPEEKLCEERTMKRQPGKFENYDRFRDLYQAFAMPQTAKYLLDNPTQEARAMALRLKKELETDKYRVR
jgi:chloramphenicol 3-O-phosphotransferase